GLRGLRELGGQPEGAGRVPDDLGLTDVGVRVEPPDDAGAADAVEVGRRPVDEVVPADEAVGDDVAAGVLLLLDDLGDVVGHDLPIAGVVDLAGLTTGVGTAQALALRALGHARITGVIGADDSPGTERIGVGRLGGRRRA